MEIWQKCNWHQQKKNNQIISWGLKIQCDALNRCVCMCGCAKSLTVKWTQRQSQQTCILSSPLRVPVEIHLKNPSFSQFFNLPPAKVPLENCWPPWGDASSPVMSTHLHFHRKHVYHTTKAGGQCNIVSGYVNITLKFIQSLQIFWLFLDPFRAIFDLRP